MSATNYILDSIPSKMIYYFLIFAALILSIGGIFWYVMKLRSQMKQYPPLDDNPDSIIGSNPEPSRQGKYGSSTGGLS